MYYQSNKPYPVSRVERKNKEYAKLLLEDYAGSSGEDTAIHQYLYQYLVKKPELKEFSSIMEHIAEVEMRHLSLLGETITQLGVQPVFGKYSKNDSFGFWSSDNVDYTIALKQMLVSNIKKEENAIKNYRYHYSIIHDRYIRELITRIIEDEEIHLKIFHFLYRKYFS